MLVLIIGIILGGIAIGAVYSRTGEVKPDSRKVRKLIIVMLVLVVGISLVSQMFVIIEAGTVGVVKRLGAVTNELPPGLHMIIPFIDQVVVLPTLKMTYEATDKPEQSKANYPDVIISALTSDGQQIRVGITARFMIQPGKAAWVLQNLGGEEEYVEKVIKTEIRGSGRRVPTKFAAYDLYTKKSYEAQKALYDEIAPKFQQNGMILDELILRNITFTAEYARTLEEKQIALENITTEKNKLEQEKIRKEQKIVAAEGDAKSIEIRQMALTKNPTIIQWEFVQKLSPNIQWGILPQDIIPVVNFQDLMEKQKKVK